MPIRNFSAGGNQKHDLTQVMRSGATPYGFCYLEGKLVMDPKEYKVILEIYRLWQSGQSLRAICRKLNERKVPTRHGKLWKHEVIKQIINRHTNDLKKVKGE